MATVTQARPASKTTRKPKTVAEIIESIPVAPASVAPWYEDRTPRPTPPAWLVFGARVRHTLIPGVWKVVREAARYGNGRDWIVRVREQAADGSLSGPVLNWKVGEVAGLATGPSVPQVAAPVHVPVEAPAAVAVETADTFSPAWFDASRAVARGDASWLPPASLVEAMVQRDAIKHELARMARAGVEADDDARAAYDDAREAEAARQVETVPCCDDSEPVPCTACVAHEGPADMSDPAWDDDHVWAPSDFTPDPADDGPGRFHRLLSERADFHRHVDEGPDAEWAADQFSELLRLARATDASDVATMIDRLATLASDYS